MDKKIGSGPAAKAGDQVIYPKAYMYLRSY